MQQRVVTITVNPAIDLASVVPELVPDRKLRCDTPTREPGGGGINVARAIRALGGSATACLPAGGSTGDLLVSLLDAEGVATRVVRIREWTRENFHLIEGTSGRQYRFCMPGPPLADGDSQRLLDEARSLDPELVVMSGSLAPGMPSDFYVHAATVLRARGARIVVDTSGDALVKCAGAGAYLLKVSLHELATLVGAAAVETAQVPAVAAQAVARGVCEVLVVSLGASGALWTTRTEQAQVVAPVVPVRSTVGAGDAMLGGIVLSLARGLPLAEAMRQGVAAGTATVMRPGTALCRREDVVALLPQVRRL